MESPGEVAWNAFNAALGRAEGQYPPFEELPAATRRALDAAADAVCRRYGAIY